MLSEKIQSLNLSKVKEKLIHHSSENWSMEKANEVEIEYKKFLNLCLNYPNESIGITIEADKFWHQHILDTKQYPKDCEAIFGEILHHDPYVFEENPKHSEIINNFEALYIKEYGQENFSKQYASSGALLSRNQYASSGALV